MEKTESNQAILLLFPLKKSLQNEYKTGLNICDVFKVSSAGIVTARDFFTIHWTGDDVYKTIKQFIKLDIEKARIQYSLGQDVRDWKVHLAQEDIKNNGSNKLNIQPILYRPFDIRFTYYTGKSRGFLCRPRPEIMRHILFGNNVGLIATRQTRDQWDVFTTKIICGHKSCSAYDINSLFPLYLYPKSVKKTKQKSFLEDISSFPAGENGREPNLSLEFVEDFSGRLGLTFVSDGKGDLKKTFGPEDIFHYMYAVFHSPAYRERYAEFLKIDFPRLPLTSDVRLFSALCALGEELTGLHLLEKIPDPIVNYPIAGDNIVEKPRYTNPQKDWPGCVWINKTQYFEDVPPEVWEFHIGGYQVCQKWLKDRKERELTYDDITHYQRIVTALDQTIRLMEAIDNAIPKWPIE